MDTKQKKGGSFKQALKNKLNFILFVTFLFKKVVKGVFNQVKKKLNKPKSLLHP